MSNDYRILVSDKLAAEGVAVLKGAGLDVDQSTGLSADELSAIIGSYDGLLVRSATKARGEGFWSHADRLRVVGRAGTGVDNIDLAAATDNRTLVMNTPGGNNTSAAEHAIAMMFALARHVPQATASMKAGRWEKSRFKGVELTDKVLGIVGLGRIGRIVADRALGLRMRVIASDPFVSADEAPEGVEMLDLDSVLERSDLVTIHAPLMNATRGLFNRDRFARMKPGARLIHVARGGIVVESDLLAALESGHLAAAAIDVWESEPTASDNPLLALPNVICTPHLGASTHEAQIRVAVQIAEQVVAYLKSGEIKNAVNEIDLN
jgi:D-3-phosphoglycerate dehydrogenase